MVDRIHLKDAAKWVTQSRFRQYTTELLHQICDDLKLLFLLQMLPVLCNETVLVAIIATRIDALFAMNFNATFSSFVITINILLF